MGSVIAANTRSPRDVLHRIFELRDRYLIQSEGETISLEFASRALDVFKPTSDDTLERLRRRSYRPQVGPFNRRYQVFVSSTYEDLKDERRLVMQALLETKCIPTGMELFPAANQEQWKLIQRVIDDCDYYIVIVGGRYGSTGPAGTSYTEMEFDYAVKTGKSVLGFFHSDLDQLPGARLEKDSKRRRRLDIFTGKIKKRICKPWSTAEGLASAIKSAILHAIEHDPKPGWVRAPFR